MPSHQGDEGECWNVSYRYRPLYPRVGELGLAQMTGEVRPVKVCVVMFSPLHHQRTVV